MDPVRISGIGSGLELESTLQQLVRAERAGPAARFNRQQAVANQQAQAFDALGSSVNALNKSLESLATQFEAPSMKATVEGDAPFSVSASTDAQSGSFDVEVDSLASAQKLRSDPFDATADVGTGTLSLSLGGTSFDVTIASGEGSPSDIAAAINDATGNPGIRATVVNGSNGAQLVFSAEETGAANTIEITASGGDGGLDALRYVGDGVNDNLTEIAAASDALIRVDGVEVSSETNNFSDVIDGIEIDAEQAEPGSTFRVDVGQDTDAMAKALDAFVEAYNDTRGVIDKQTAFNPETNVAGPLQGDAAVRSLSSTMRDSLNFVQTGSVRVLSQVGIETDTNGRLSFDRAAFDAAVNENPDDVASLLGSAGLAGRFEARLSGFEGSDGLIASRGESLDQRLERIADDRARLDERIERFEDRLRRQFTALDSTVSQLQQDGNFLAQQLGSLPGFGR